MFPRNIQLLTAILLIAQLPSFGQLCGCPGVSGPVNVSSNINTYYPPLPTTTLNNGSTTVQLASVPPTDAHGNSFGNIPISPCDLLLFIQMQDGNINTSNSNLYGSGTSSSGPDGLGGTGFISSGNAGKYEYALALNNVPLTGGVLNFKAAGTNGGLVNDYFNSPGDGTTIGKKTFQVLRVPQYSTLTLASDIICPPFNGNVGGVICMDVAGDMNFNNFKIDASSKGFRGGFQIVQLSDCNTALTYVTPTSIVASGKGESIAGTPQYMWDGYNEVDNGTTWLGFPGYPFGKGAPANGGGGGNDHNAGGGGGGNGGAGGAGGNGWQPIGFCVGDPGNPGGGRPGINFPSPVIDRIFFGGGGGGGDANNATTGTKGGVGGGIVIITAGRVVGNGSIFSNGGNGDRGVFLNNPDGAGGGGAGGTIVLRAVSTANNATLTLQANGGKGGNTIFDLNNEHGPGGGGGGGIIWHNVTGATVNTQVTAGPNGLTNDGNPGGIPWNSKAGQAGLAFSLSTITIPTYLNGFGANCFPLLEVKKSERNPGLPGIRLAGTTALYTMLISNQGPGGATGITLNDRLPNGFVFNSATISYTGGASGPTTPVNSGSGFNPLLGTFAMPVGSSITISMLTNINSSVLPGIYHNGTQVLYRDPTRSINNPNRLITPRLFSLSGQNNTYETGLNAGLFIPGKNYDGDPGGPNDEDVHIKAPGGNEIRVPKAFSPNGDGLNDKLEVFYNGIVKLNFFKVFNRWGQLMFETNDLNLFWDGNFKGIPQPLETYVWLAEGISDDGKTLIRRGQTILIR